MALVPARRFWIRLFEATTIAALLYGAGCSWFRSSPTSAPADKDKEERKDGGKTDKPNDPTGGAKTPEDFVRLYAEAEKSMARSNDFEKTLETMRPFLVAAERDALGDFIAVIKAAKAYGAALDAKFGKDPNDKEFSFDDGGKGRPELKSYEIKGKKDVEGGRVVVTVFKTEVREKEENGKKVQEDVYSEELLLLVKEGDVWKMYSETEGGEFKVEDRKLGDKTVKVRVHSGDIKPGGRIDKQRKEFAKEKEILTAQAKMVNDGKYTSRKDAKDALRKATDESRRNDM
jgi:hypothetical protein